MSNLFCNNENYLIIFPLFSLMKNTKIKILNEYYLNKTSPGSPCYNIPKLWSLGYKNSKDTEGCISETIDSICHRFKQPKIR